MKKNIPGALRVLFHLNDFGDGGTETALIAWLHALDAAGLDINLSVGFPTAELDTWRAAAFPRGTTVHILASAPWMHALHEVRRQHRLKGPMKLVKNVLTYGVIRPLMDFKFKRLARDVDVVWDFDLSLRHVAGKHGVTWLGVNHFSIGERFAKTKARRIRVRQAQLARYDAIGVQTPHMLREGEQIFPRVADKLRELPNIIDPVALARRALEPAEVPSGDYIVSVARLDELQKDHRTLVNAFFKLRRSGLTWCDLCIVGEGPFRAELEALSVELGIAEHVHFVGFRANPHPFIAGARALVLSSRYEGFGMVLGEAMPHKVPVISTDCPTGPRDLLDHGRAGLLVPIGDALKMSAAMRTLLTDELTRAELIERGFERVQHYRPAVAAERLIDLVRPSP